MRYIFIDLELICWAVLSSLYLKLPHRVLKEKVLENRVTTANTCVSNTLLFYISDRIRELEKFIPWTYKCYQQALTASLFLKRRRQHHTLTLGFKKEGQKRYFHAWITCRKLVVTGGYKVAEYTMLANYPS